LLLRTERHALSPLRRAELDKFGAACRARPELRGVVQTLFDAMLPRGRDESAGDASLAALLEQNGFDRTQHEQIRADLKDGRIGLAQNRLPASAVIEDVLPGDVLNATAWRDISGAAVPAVSAGVSPAKQAPSATHAPGPLLFTPIDPSRPASITSRRLPHWRQDGVTYFITFRLADALPHSALVRLDQSHRQLRSRYPDSPTSAQLAEMAVLDWEFQESELDRGHGACVLRDERAADVVEGALRHFDAQRYQLGNFVLMPNHVHVLVKPVMGHSLSDILHSWKSYTSHELNRVLERTGRLWQDESFDHIVRNEAQLERIQHYIRNNPAAAGLARGFRVG